MNGYPDDEEDDGSLRSFLRRRFQQGRQPVFVANDPGISGRSSRPSDVIRAQQIQAQQVPVQQSVPIQQPDSAFPQSRPRIADPITFDETHLRELESKKDPFWKRLAAQSVRAAQAATGQQPSPVLTSRERDMERLQGRLGRDVALARARQQIDQGSLVPFQLPDGSWTVAPKKSIGSVLSRQQNQQATLSVRRQQMDAHNARWDQMGKHEAAQDAQRLFNSGAADDNDDLKEEIARRMGLPSGTRLPNHDKGQLATDDQGNFQIVDTRKGTARPVTQPSETGRPRAVGSFQSTLEQGRNQRAAAQQAAANQRAANAQAGADRRAGMRVGNAPKVDAETRKYAMGLVKQVNDANDAIANFDKNQRADIPLPPEAAARRAQLVEKAKRVVERLKSAGAGYEAGQDERGYPYAKPSVGQTSTTEDPKVRAYANKFFSGDYAAAQAAIQKQRGQ